MIDPISCYAGAAPVVASNISAPVDNDQCDGIVSRASEQPPPRRRTLVPRGPGVAQECRSFGAVMSDLIGGIPADDRDASVRHLRGRVDVRAQRLELEFAGRCAKSMAGSRPASSEPAGSRLVLQIRQRHKIEGIQDDARSRKRIAHSQQHVFDTLLAARPKVVFVEGRIFDAKARHPPELAYEIRALKGYEPGQVLDADLENFFYKYQGAEIYACLNDDVQLHGTTSSALNSDLLRALDHRLKFGDASAFTNQALRDLIFTARELRALSRAIQWSKSNQGLVPVVVFGALHDFAKFENQIDVEVGVFDERHPVPQARDRTQEESENVVVRALLKQRARFNSRPS